MERGDVAAALASAELTYDETFTTAAETNNPLRPFATVASWEGDRLSVHESTQWPMMARHSLATVFNVLENNVRVLVPYLGGGFGAGLRTSAHTILTALAARIVGHPVKLVLTRPQMFTSIGHRPQTTQRLRLGATREGRLVAIDHEGTSTVGTEEANFGTLTMVTPLMYACPNVATHDRQVQLNIPNPGAMRAPGKAEGNFAIESALDELSYALAVDPIELRLRNYAEVQPQSGLPWSSKALRECYLAGAQRFGWAKRNPEIRSMREGNWLIGYGMAGVTFGWYQAPCQASISICRDGTAHVRSAATDIGTGTYTIATQLSAELLGLDIGHVRVEIGDSDLPPAPQSGGSGLAASLSGAIHDAAGNLLQADYLIPVNADVPDLEVVFVGNPDNFSPVGIKGLGEIGVVGVSAAIANAVYHATGRRIRSLPITIDQLL
jgi:xanthine dehydrogenase YagR molybdenum-binding subunit